MSQTYTRKYLQNLASETRKGWIKSMYLDHSHGKNVIASVIDTAKEGEASIIIPMIDPFVRYRMQNHNLVSWQKNPITPDEVICILQEIFPDSKLTYEEKWVQVSQDKQELKKGICIDWS